MSTLPDSRQSRWQPLADLVTHRGVAIGMMMLLGALAIGFVAAAPLLGLKDEAAIQHWLTAGRSLGPLAVVAVSATFCILALLGAPQFLLVAWTAAMFGPAAGFAYSFVGNMLACLLGFALGKGLGAGALAKIGGPRLERFMTRLAQREIATCALIRLVPTAPFMIVNLALGATSIRLPAFLIGTALGSTPKIALLVWAGAGLSAVIHGGGPLHWLLLACVIAAWIAMGLIARAWAAEPEAAQS